MKYLLTVVSTFLLFSLTGCQNDHREVVKEQREASKEIRDAQQNVAKEQREAAGEINDARARGDIDDVQDEKIEATKEIAKAERKVEDEKIEATKEITDAKRDAGETAGTYRKQ
jgi:hypothetical protein